MIAGQIEIQMLADLARLKRDMDEAKTLVGGAVDKMGQAVDRLRNAFIGLAAAYVGTHTVAEFIRTSDAMAAMEGRLRNVIKSTADYQAAQQDIYRIAQQNNVGLQETATLYTRLYDPITRMGGSVRNVTVITEALSTALRLNAASSAESSSAILQFSQAMASGVLRGEEFNSVNEAAPTFMRAFAQVLGVTQGELRKMAEEGKLTADVVGNAMPAALLILQGQAEGLRDNFGQAMGDLRNDASLLAAQLDKTTGTTAGLAEMAGLGSDMLREFTNILRDNRNAAELAGQGLDGVGLAIRVVGTIAETVLVLMSDVSFVLQGIGRDAGGMAAQVAAVVTGNFAHAKEIGRQMKIDADAARAQLDQYQASVLGMTNRVLQSRDALRQHGLSSAENSAEMQRLEGRTGNTAGGYATLTAATKASTDATKAKAAAAREAQKEEEKQTAMLLELAGFSKTYGEEVIRLNAALHSGRMTTEQYTAAHDALQARQPGAIALKREEIEAAKARNAEFDIAFDKIERERLATEGQIGAARTMLERIEYETAAVKMSSTERAIATAERDLERQGVVRGTLAYDAYIEKIRAAVVRKEDVDKSIAENKRLEEEAKRTAQSISQGLTDSLFRAFESGGKFFDVLWDGIKNTVKTTVLQPIIANIAKPFTDAFGSVVSQISSTILRPQIATDGITGFLSTLWNGLTSIVSGFSSSMGSVMSGIGSSVGSLFGSSAGNAIGSAAGGGSGLGSLASLGSAAIGGLGSLGAGVAAGFSQFSAGVGLTASLGNAAAVGGSTGAGIGIGAAGPYVLAAIAVLAIANKLFGSKGGPKTSGLANTAGAAGLRGGAVQSGVADAQAAEILNTVEGLYRQYAQTLGGQAGQFTGTAFFAQDPKGDSPTQLILDAAVNGQTVFSRNNNLQTGANIEDVGRSNEAFAAAVAEAQTRALLASLKATTFSDAAIASQIAAINANSSAEQISSQLQAIAADKQRRDQEAAAAQQAQNPPAWAGTGGAIGITAQVSADVLDLYARTAVATEKTAVSARETHGWLAHIGPLVEAVKGSSERAVTAVYESNQFLGDRLRGPIYEVNSNIDLTRNVLYELIDTLKAEMQQLRVQIYNSEQTLLAPAKESADYLQRATRGGQPQIYTAAAA